MDNKIEKLYSIKDSLLPDGCDVRLYVLIERVDLVDKWDIVISAENMEKRDTQETLVSVVENLKKVFSNNIDFLSRIVLLSSEESFAKKLVRSFKKEKIEKEEFDSLNVEQDFTLGKVWAIYVDYKGISLEESERDPKTPLAIEEVTEF